jgi:hypothetical protein
MQKTITVKNETIKIKKISDNIIQQDNFVPLKTVEKYNSHG